MLKEHTKQSARETADRFANKDAELYLKAEAIIWKGEGWAARLSNFGLLKKKIGAMSKKSDGRLD